MFHFLLPTIMITLLLLGCGGESSDTEAYQELSLTVTTAQNKRDRSPQNSPILEYRFDDCSLAEGLLNRELTLDGENFITLPVMHENYQEGFSFSSWVRFDKKANEGKLWETIFSLGNDDSNKAYHDKHATEIWLNRYYNDNRLYFAFTNGDRDNPCADIKTTFDVLTPGVRQHIAVTIDHENYPHIYIDGTEVETEVAWHNAGGACKLPSTRRDLCYIGKPNDAWMGVDADGGTHDHKDNNLLVGSIDEVKFFNHTLDASQIASIYKYEKNGKNYDGSSRRALECSISVIDNTPVPQPTPIPPTEATHTIMIDGDTSDWNTIAGVTQNGNTLKAYMDEHYAYFLITSQDILHPSAIFFIDADNDAYTGHQASEWTSSGADYAIGTVGKLYIAQSNDNSWVWDKESLDMAEAFVAADGVIELKVKKSDFHLNESFRVGARVFNDKQEIIALPDPFYSYTKTATSPKSFDAIKAILRMPNATYISVGDSTRADDAHFGNGDIFATIKAQLGSNVHAILHATAGHSAKEWAGNSAALNWQYTADAIPEDGTNTIVNISLGINDIRMGETQESFLASINDAITKIKTQRPSTHFIFTMPNPMIGVESQAYIQAYRSLASRYPMIDTESIFKSADFSLYRATDAQEYGEDIRIHLSKKGEELVAKKILSYLQ